MSSCARGQRLTDCHRQNARCKVQIVNLPGPDCNRQARAYAPAALLSLHGTNNAVHFCGHRNTIGAAVMSWSFRIGRIFGIDLYVHATFFLLPVWVTLTQYARTQSVAAALVELLFVLLVFAIIVLPECGPPLAARQFGVPTRDITLLPIGGVARLERMPE